MSCSCKHPRYRHSLLDCSLLLPLTVPFSFARGIQQMLESASKRQYFSFDEYKSMLCLQCGVDQTLGEAAMTDSNLNMHLIELHGLVVDDWEDTNSQASSS